MMRDLTTDASRTTTFWGRIFLPFALGYFLSQLLRSVNAVVSADLVAELGVSAFTVGLLTSAYFFAFAAAQLPVGLSLDRFGPRRTESFLLLFAAMGAALFALAQSANALIAGRALIGFGVSACLMASFHAFALWAPPGRLSFLSGAVMSAGAAGAFAATSPVEWAVARFGWRPLFLALAVLTLLTTGLLFALAPEKAVEHGDHGSERQSETPREAVSAFIRVFKSAVFWSIAPFSIVHQGSYLAIQSLWAGPWLSDVAGLSRSDVASRLSILAIGMAIGFTGLGYAAGKWRERGGSTITVWVAAAVIFQTAQLALALGDVRHASLLWATFGVFGAAGMLSYGILTTRFPVTMAGRVNTALNVLVFSGAFALQAGIGAVIEWTTRGMTSGSEGSEGATHFPAAGYRTAFLLVLGLQVAGLLWLGATSRWRQSRESPAQASVSA